MLSVFFSGLLHTPVFISRRLAALKWQSIQCPALVAGLTFEPRFHCPRKNDLVILGVKRNAKANDVQCVICIVFNTEVDIQAHCKPCHPSTLADDHHHYSGNDDDDGEAATLEDGRWVDR